MTVSAHTTRSTILLYLLMLLYGGFTTVVGSVLGRLLAEFGVPLSDGGLFYAVQSIGYVIGIVLSGLIIERFDKRLLIMLFYSALAAVLIALNFAPGLAFFLCFILLAGLTAMMVDVLLNASVAQLHEKNRGFYMNLLHCCFGVGSFLGPVFAGYTVERFGSWRPAYLVLGVVCAAAVGMYGFLTGGEKADVSAATVKTAVPLRSVASGKTLLGWLIFFCYIGHQGGLNNWLPTYLGLELNIDAVAAGAGLSSFWLGLILSRFCASFLTRRVDEKTLSWIGCCLAGISLLLGVLIGGKGPLFLGVAAAGFFSGALIPMVLTLAYAWYPEAKGVVSTVLFTGICAGQVVFPWLMGVIEGHSSLKTAMIFDAIMLLVTGVLAIGLPRAKKLRS